MQVVDMLNEIYIVFDTLSEKHNVYKVSVRGGGRSQSLVWVYWSSGGLGSVTALAKQVWRKTLVFVSPCRPTQVETIRDAYMVVAGVPNKTTFHAHHICDMALDMLSSIDHLKDPSTGDNIQIRVGELRSVTQPQKKLSRHREELPVNFPVEFPIAENLEQCYQLPSKKSWLNGITTLFCLFDSFYFSHYPKQNTRGL